MINNNPELLFATRGDFRAWLIENSETSGGVWLLFGKTKEVISLTANDALEEALCFGWIDGKMKSIDGSMYRKYFTKRRPKSIWSEKNKKIVEELRKKGLMTESGENAVRNAIQNGMWDAPKEDPVTDEQIAAFAEKLRGASPAYENYMNMPRSVRVNYTRWYLSFKNDEARKKGLEKIIHRLDKNLRTM
jgi:uncharacterized protein YdeI (YjbR/CyaY-like superfamily)